MVNYFINLAIKWIYRILVLFCSLTVQYNTTASGASPTTLRVTPTILQIPVFLEVLGCATAYMKKKLVLIIPLLRRKLHVIW